MEILIKLPDGWLDHRMTENLSWITRTVRDEVRNVLVEAVKEQVKVPSVVITPEEVKERVIEKLAQAQVEAMNFYSRITE